LTSNTTQLLLIGVLFAIIGLFTLVLKKKKKLVGLLPLTAGVAAILLTIVGPLSNSQKHLDNVLHIDKDDIILVKIKPTKYVGWEKRSLTKYQIKIANRETIDSLCLAVINGKITNSLIKDPNWICLLKFEKKNGTSTEFQVLNAGQNTIIEVRSAGDYGWDYGTIEANSLGMLLPELVK
jgi:hypothetical protein